MKLQIADLQYEDSESEESSEEEYDQDDPLAVLYSYVRHYKSGIFAEPFLQLPSKREHPDYYLTIGDPISLNEVCLYFVEITGIRKFPSIGSDKDFSVYFDLIF